MQAKSQGGLGIENLDIQNKCLLSKWIFKLLNENNMWQELLRNKYIKDKTLGSCVKKPADSHLLKSLMNIKDISFWRNLLGQNLWDWHQIMTSLQDVNLEGERDTFVWNLQSSGMFCVKSMYSSKNIYFVVPEKRCDFNKG